MELPRLASERMLAADTGLASKLPEGQAKLPFHLRLGGACLCFTLAVGKHLLHIHLLTPDAPNLLVPDDSHQATPETR